MTPAKVRRISIADPGRVFSTENCSFLLSLPHSHADAALEYPTWAAPMVGIYGCKGPLGVRGMCAIRTTFRRVFLKNVDFGPRRPPLASCSYWILMVFM